VPIDCNATSTIQMKPLCYEDISTSPPFSSLAHQSTTKVCMVSVQ
jgi:hypothetical protein